MLLTSWRGQPEDESDRGVQYDTDLAIATTTSVPQPWLGPMKHCPQGDSNQTSRQTCFFGATSVSSSMQVDAAQALSGASGSPVSAASKDPAFLSSPGSWTRQKLSAFQLKSQRALGFKILARQAAQTARPAWPSSGSLSSQLCSQRTIIGHRLIRNALLLQMRLGQVAGCAPEGY